MGGRKEGRRRKEGWMEGRKDGWKEGRIEGRKDGKKEGRKDGRKEGSKVPTSEESSLTIKLSGYLVRRNDQRTNCTKVKASLQRTF